MASPQGTDRPDATVVVWRTTVEGRDYLAVRRRDEGGDGTWTVPTARCVADERLDDAATRALWEQTGLVLALTPMDAPDGGAVFAARADADAVPVLDDAHDAHAWLPVREAIDRCSPDQAARAIGAVERWLTEG